ncbi:PAS domain-containing protein [Pseudomonadota bacterium]
MALQEKPYLASVATQLKERGISASSLSDDETLAVAIHFHSEIVDCNQQFFDLTGYTSDEVIGANAWMFFPPESIKILIEKIQEKSTDPYQVMAMKRDGEEYRVEITAQNIPLGGEEARAVLVRAVS